MGVAGSSAQESKTLSQREFYRFEAWGGNETFYELGCLEDGEVVVRVYNTGTVFRPDHNRFAQQVSLDVFLKESRGSSARAALLKLIATLVP